MALIGVRRALIKPKRSLILPGPPSATFQNTGAGTSSGTAYALTTGTAFSTRLVVVMISIFTMGGNAAISSAVFDGSNNALSFGTAATTAVSNGFAVFYVVGAVPTGTSSSLVVTWTVAQGSSTQRFTCYTMDSSQMASTTPVVVGNTASAAATSDTLNLTVVNSGSVVLAADTGGNNVTKTFSGSPTMTTDSDFNVTKAGAHANSVTAGSPSLTINWSPAFEAEAFGALVFR